MLLHYGSFAEVDAGSTARRMLQYSFACSCNNLRSILNEIRPNLADVVLCKARNLVQDTLSINDAG